MPARTIARPYGDDKRTLDLRPAFLLPPSCCARLPADGPLDARLRTELRKQMEAVGFKP